MKLLHDFLCLLNILRKIPRTFKHKAKKQTNTKKLAVVDAAKIYFTFFPPYYCFVAKYLKVKFHHR